MEVIEKLKKLYERDKEIDREIAKVDTILSQLKKKEKELEQKLEDAKSKEAGQYISESPNIKEVG